MNLEDQKQKLLKFFGSGPGARFGSLVSPITRKISIIPKRSIPQQIVSRLQSSTSSGMDDGITTTQRDVSSLGKVTLNLEQTKNNLERILQVISEDYKNTQEQNKKEADEYRKRIANRGRIFGKKELGDRKTDILGGIKKYVGSFFSGAGGAIRGLAAFNLLEAILNKDPKKIISSLLGIGMTYLPAIGGLIGLSVAKSLGKRLLGLGGARAAAGGATGAAGLARGAGSLGKMGRFGGKAALVAGGIGLASSLFNKDGGDQTQQRLEDLTQQQKASVEPGSITSVPQDDLKRFEALNNKFEKALDFLLGKQKETPTQRTSSGGGGGGGGASPGQVDPGVMQMSSLTGIHKQAADIVAGYESASSGGYNAMNRGTGGDSPEGPKTYFGKNLTDMTIDEVTKLQENRSTLNAAGRYQFVGNTLPTAMRNAGLNPTDMFSPLNQDKMFVATLRKSGPTPWTGPWGLGKYSQQQLDILERASKTSVAPVLPTPNTYPSMSSTILNESVVDTSSVVRRNIPAPQAATPTIVPMVVPQQTSPQQSSAAVGNNDTVPSIDTTYPENFLALYSKLIYQIV